MAVKRRLRQAQCHRHGRSPPVVHPPCPTKRDRLSWSSAASRHKQCSWESMLSLAEFNPLTGAGDYSTTSNNSLWSWYTGRWWVSCYIWYSDEWTGRGRSPPRPLLAVPNVIAHPSTASVPITVSLYNSPLLCCFNASIKGLIALEMSRRSDHTTTDG